MNTTNPATKKVVGYLCLYGAQHCGYGYLLATFFDAKPHCSPDPKATRGLTDCLFQAADDLRSLGVHEGILQIFAPGGERMAEVDLARGIPWYGDLKWEAAPVYVVPAEVRS